MIKYILGFMLKLFLIFKVYYLFFYDVVNIVVINIKEIVNLLKLIMFIMGFCFLEMIYMYVLLFKELILFFIL